uniref:LYC1 C-terminal domain-containing protein n=1 Tax=Hyaloperonospora arabidopsidis (strain Emoy2) TaxID=559515 RepID=M4BHZ5_HYAAE
MSKFRVVQLTQEALKVQCKLDDFEEWGAPMLDMAQYQCKEALQRASPFSQRGSIFWALVDHKRNENNDDADLVAGQTVLYCHCESHRFECVVRHSSGEIERGYSLHIGSVFTLPEHRKQGLAKFFLEEVAKQLKQIPGAVLSVLYSDIGPTYYDRLGWKLHPSKMATIDVAELRTTNLTNSRNIETVSLLLDANLDKFLRADNEKLVRVLEHEKSQGRDAFVVLPTRDSIEWQFCIGEHYARTLGYKELPSHCGVKINEEAFIIWCHDVKESTLYILRARLPDVYEDAAESVQLLLNEALMEARKFDLNRVAIWDPPSCLLHSDVRCRYNIKFADREDSLSSAMLFCHWNSPDLAMPLPHWMCNEKYSWV